MPFFLLSISKVAALMSPPLKGMMVVDLSRLIPGPFCSLILSDLGARVIKVEDMASGDYLRDLPPILDDRGGALYHAFNRGKEHFVVNLREKTGQAILLRLISEADVFIESYRPGVFKRIGFSYAMLSRKNRRLVMASITGFGQKGPNRNKAGHDLNYMALSGQLPTHQVPQVQWADLVGGSLWAAIAILSALVDRKRGRYLDISMTDSMSFMGLADLILAQMGIQKTVLNGLVARYQVYETLDGRWLALAALENKFWNRFCELIGKKEWQDKDGSYPDRRADIHLELKVIFKTKSIAEWLQLFQNEDLCVTPVLSPSEVLGQFKGRGFSVTRNGLLFPTIPLGGNKSAKIVPPKKGEHTKKILAELRYSKKAIQTFFDQGVVV